MGGKMWTCYGYDIIISPRDALHEYSPSLKSPLGKFFCATLHILPMDEQHLYSRPGADSCSLDQLLLLPALPKSHANTSNILLFRLIR